MKLEFSAGGIVFRQAQDKYLKKGYEILLCQHSQHHGWVFPKGFIGDNIKSETKEETAVREVKEETGIIGKILEELEPVLYWYEMDGIKRKKTVYYFLMEFLGGDINDHDWEMENVEWLPIEKVEERLTYDSDKKIWQQAKKLIANI
jgi:8-oxo-dGTP pyrophosphatase MutT (NUDIX family)